jgi:hypothetical protein
MNKLTNLNLAIDFLPTLIQNGQQRFDCLAVSSAVSDNFNGRVPYNIELTNQLVMFGLQCLFEQKYRLSLQQSY